MRAGFSGDGGPAVNAQLFTDDGESGWPAGLAVDSDGSLYIADRGNARVRKVSTAMPSGITRVITYQSNR